MLSQAEVKMTDFKVGDVVRVVKRPTPTWAADMYVGREFKVEWVGTVSNEWCVNDSDGFYIPFSCVELASAPPKRTDGWQPWNPPSEDPAPRVRPARDRRKLDAKFGPRPVDEWDV